MLLKESGKDIFLWDVGPHLAELWDWSKEPAGEQRLGCTSQAQCLAYTLCLPFPSIHVSFLYLHCRTGLAATQPVSGALKCVQWMWHSSWQSDTTPQEFVCSLSMENGRQWMMT